MAQRHPTIIGQEIGEYCVELIQKVIPMLVFETEQEIHRFCFGAGIVVLTLAKYNAAGLATPAGPQVVRAICDAIEEPFAKMIEKFDISILDSEVSTFLPDESELELFCRWSNTSKDDLAASNTSTNLSVFLSIIYASREKQYYRDLRAAADMPEIDSSAMGVMIFVYKRFMLHVYGFKTDMRSIYLENELVERSIIPGNFFNHSFMLLHDCIESLFRK